WPVEPRGPHDDRVEIAALEAAEDELLGLELRLPVAHVRVVRRVLGEPVGGPLVGAERRIRRDVDESADASAPRSIEGELGATDVDVEHLPHLGDRMDHTGAVKHRRATDVVEQAVQYGRV